MQLLRQNRNEGTRVAGGHQLDRLFALFPFQKTGGGQLFQNPGAGGRRTQSLALGSIRHIFFTGVLHSRQQSIFGEMFWRAGFPLLDGGIGNRQRLSLGEFRQRLFLWSFLRLRGIFQTGVISGIQPAPAGALNGFPFCGKLLTGADQRGGGFLVEMGFRHRAQQPCGHQLQHRFFPHREGGQIRIPKIAGGDHRMVVGHFLIVDDRLRVAGNADPLSERHGIGGEVDQHRQALRHIRGQIPAVRPGISTQLFLIEVLQIVQRLLGGKPQQAVGVPL